MKKWLFIALLFCPLWLMAQNPTPPEGKTPEEWANVAYYNNDTISFRPIAVLMGDSITRGWAREDNGWLFEHGMIGRGISGQTTPQMLIRFRPHVLDLAPEYVVILAGINDIARNTGYIPLQQTFANLCKMVDEARNNGVKPVLCTLTPADEIGWRKEIGDPSPQVDSLNAMIRAYAEKEQIPLADYYSAMVDENGGMRDEFRTVKKNGTKDGVHPNLAGYKVMEKVLGDLLDRLK